MEREPLKLSKKVIMVDYENVQRTGLEGLEKLNSNDKIYIFFSRNSNIIRIDFLAKAKKIGAETGEHADIVQYRKNQQLMASVSQYLTLFDSKVDELIVSDWKESDLIEYVENSSKRQENIDKAISVAEENKLSKAEQTVEFVEDTTEPEPVGEEEITTTLTSDIDESFFNMSGDTDEEVSEPPVVTDDDISFDIDTDDFLSDIEGID